jgi:hypothetical protein
MSNTIIENARDWHEFVIGDWETYPRDDAKVLAEFENGAQVQASYSSDTGYWNLDPTVSTEAVGGPNALLKRWRYLRRA